MDPVTRQPVKKRLRNKGKQPRTVLTVNGRVKLVRRWWHAPDVGSIAPVDELVDAQGKSVSHGVREMACRLNNNGVSFDRAAEDLKRTALVEMCGEQLRQLVLSEGQAVLAAQAANLIAPAFQASQCVVDPKEPKSTTRIYSGMDGVMVPLVTEKEKVARRKKVRQKRQKSGKRCRPLPPRKRGTDQSFKEFKTIVFYDEHCTHWHEVLSSKSRTQIGSVLRREAGRLGFRYADERLAVVDGAPWIYERLTEDPVQFPIQSVGLNFYHLSENVHRARRIVFGDEDAAGQQWAGSLLHTLKHEGYEPAWEQLSTWRATLRTRKAKKAVDQLTTYVSNHRDMINYPAFIAKGWQIGSGPTEARCKTTTSRLKGRGRRWNTRNAQAVAALTTLRDSDQWDAFWKTPVTATI